MSAPLMFSHRPSLGIIGFGAFGRLMAQYLSAFFVLRAYDPLLRSDTDHAGLHVLPSSLEQTAGCEIVVFATPVSSLESVARAAAPHMQPGTLVLDVGSVKMLPAAILREVLPAHVSIVATHPLFGPESARDGIGGLKIAVCPIRGRGGLRTAAFLRQVLGLKVILTAPEIHDRDVAVVQGLTHLVARLLDDMSIPPSSRFTTRSFDLLMQAVDLVRHDAPEVFDAILRSNPHAYDVQCRFFRLAKELESELNQSRDTVVATMKTQDLYAPR